MKILIAIFTILVIGGSVWFYLNSNNANLKTMDSVNNQGKIQDLHSGYYAFDKQSGSGGVCDKFASVSEVGKVFDIKTIYINFSENDAGIACQYLSDPRETNKFTALVTVADWTNKKDRKPSAYVSALLDGSGGNSEWIGVGIIGEYSSEGVSGGINHSLSFADSSDKFFVNMISVYGNSVTKDRLISLAKLINNNLNK